LKEVKGAMGDTTDVFCAYDNLAATDALIPNPRNPNRHPDEQIRLLAKVIEHQGWRCPITVSNRSGFVIRGHGRLMAAKLLGLAEVPVDYQDYATEAEEWADLIADNRIAELAELDKPTLKDVLEELDTGALDMELTGFTEDALKGLMSEFDTTEEQAAGIAEAIATKQEQVTATEIAETMSDRLSEAIREMAENAPHRLTNAHAIVLPKRAGSHPLLILDDSVADVLAEIVRYHEAGETSPLTALMAARFPLRATDTPIPA